MPGRKTTVYLDEDLVKEAKKIAIDKDTNLSQILNNYLKIYVQENNKEEE
jgi:hypothetical protein